MNSRRFFWPALFWCTVVLAIAWGSWVSMMIAVLTFYHPMSAHGDTLHTIRHGALIVPLLGAVVMFVIWLKRRPLARRVYLSGLAVIVAAALLPLLPPIDSGYRQVYWLGEKRHEIPWQYGPYNGSTNPGGKNFVLEASISDLSPKYATRDPTARLSKAVDYNNGNGGAAPYKMCETSQYHFECVWKREDFVYTVSGSPDLLPSNASELMVSVADLLDSFETSTP